MTTESNNTELKLPTMNNENTSNVDDFGYDVEPGTSNDGTGNPASGDETPEAKKELPKLPSQKDETPSEETKSSTGYGKQVEAPKPKEEVKPAPKTEETPEETDESKKVNEIVNSLPDTLDKAKVLKFATDNKLSSDQLKAYSELIKAEEISTAEARKKYVEETRAEWLTQLKTDNDFGGEHFDTNVSRVEKILEKHMPNLKKELTSTGNMLPPYIMKDLLGVWKVLNPTTDLVTGDPTTVKKEKHFLEEMYE